MTELNHGNAFLNVVRPALVVGDAERMANDVRARWSVVEVCSLLNHPNVDIRRVASMVIGLIGDRRQVGCLTGALKDTDRLVNEMAEHSLWSIWFRAGSQQAAKSFRHGLAHLADEAYDKAIIRFEEAAGIDPHFAEAFNQCAIAHFFVGHWDASIFCASKAIKLMPTHFGAIAGMGHCYTQMNDLERALKCYRRAVAINPRMKPICDAIHSLEARMREENDSSGTFFGRTISV